MLYKVKQYFYEKNGRRSKNAHCSTQQIHDIMKVKMASIQKALVFAWRPRIPYPVHINTISHLPCRSFRSTPFKPTVRTVIRNPVAKKSNRPNSQRVSITQLKPPGMAFTGESGTKRKSSFSSFFSDSWLSIFGWRLLLTCSRPSMDEMLS